MIDLKYKISEVYRQALFTPRPIYSSRGREAKNGKRLYGTSYYVESPVILKSLDEPMVILKTGMYNDEIMNDILKNINSRTKFIL